MEEEAEIYDGMRAHFPLTFGKQSKSQTPLEVIHNATRRGPSKEKDLNTIKAKPDLPSLSSSSKSWLQSLRKPNPNSTPSGDEPSIEPSRPLQKSEDEDDGVMVGPPPPPAGGGSEDGDEDEDDDGVMIGPPPPPVWSTMDDSDEEENMYRIPMSNEIILKGHTKVLFPPVYMSLWVRFVTYKCAESTLAVLWR